MPHKALADDFLQNDTLKFTWGLKRILNALRAMCENLNSKGVNFMHTHNEILIREELATLIDSYYRKSQKNTFKKLAENTGVSRPVISKMRYEAFDVSLKHICQVLDALGYELVIQKKEF